MACVTSNVTDSMGPTPRAALERPEDATRSTRGIIWALSQQQQQHVTLPTTAAAGAFTPVAAAAAVTPRGICQRSSATAAAAALMTHGKDASGGGASSGSGGCCNSNRMLMSRQHMSRTAEEVDWELLDAVFEADDAADGVHPFQASLQIDLLSSWQQQSQQQLQQQQPAGHTVLHSNESLGSTIVEFGSGGLLTTPPWVAAISADAAVAAAAIADGHLSGANLPLLLEGCCDFGGVVCEWDGPCVEQGRSAGEHHAGNEWY